MKISFLALITLSLILILSLSTTVTAQTVEKITEGFQFTEGPLWDPEGFLLFSDIPANTIYQWQSNGKTSIFRHPSHNANGNAWDLTGRLLTAEHGLRRIARTETDGTVHTLVSEYQNKRLNSPNDLVVKSDGSIYFTDPPYGIKPEERELDINGVYRLAPDGTLTLLVDDFVRPNGISFSPDETRLYVNDSQQRQIWVFAVYPDGSLGEGKIFADFKDNQDKGFLDGIKVDLEGNVYSTGPGGIWVFSPTGELLTRIKVPEIATNLAWGNDNQTLFITAGKSVYRLRL